MFCVECGQRLPDAAKFCAACGTRVAAPPVGGTTADPVSAIDAVFSSDEAVAERAKREIIDTVNVQAMMECARRALRDGDQERADFWYLEWVTAPDTAPSIVRDGVFEYAEKLLLPAGRYSEAELYLSALEQWPDGATAAEAQRRRAQVEKRRLGHGLPRLRYSDTWRNVDLYAPLDPRASAEDQYARSVAWLFNKIDAGDLKMMVDPRDPQHLSYLAGYVIGVRGSYLRAGGDVEAAIQGVIDGLAFERASREAKATKARKASKPAPAPKPTAPPKPTENSLGNHVDRLFSDRKYAEQIKRTLSCASGLNDDFVVAAIPVSTKLGDSSDYYDQYMIFTRDRVAIVKKSGMFSSGETHAFLARDVSQVGIGESDHYEAQGMTGRPTAWVSITLEMRDSRRFTRHYFLGHNETEVNDNIPYIKGALERMASVGYRIGDGPAWNSSGGYRTSYGWGIGVWR